MVKITEISNIILGGTSKHIFISENSQEGDERSVVKWICQNYPGIIINTFDWGWSSHTTRGMFRLFIGNTSNLDANGYHKYACGYFIKYISDASPYFKVLNFYNGTITEKMVAFQ